MAEFIPAILFVLSSGLLFQKQFRENAGLVVIAGLIGLVSSYFLVDQMLTIWIKFREPSHQTAQPAPAPAPQAQIAAAPVQEKLDKNLNERVAEAVARARQFEMDAREQASRSAIVVDQALAAAQGARDAAGSAKSGSAGYAAQSYTDSGADGPVSYSGGIDDQSLRNGVGTMQWKDGSYYEGEWSHGSRNGLGVYHFSADNRKGLNLNLGQFDGVELKGLGKSTWKDGSRCEGQFDHGKFTGLGVWFFADGVLQAGQFIDSSLEGYGVQHFTDKSQWKGQFHRNQLNGYGAKFDAQGGVIEQGIYENGTLEQSLAP